MSLPEWDRWPNHAASEFMTKNRCGATVTAMGEQAMKTSAICRVLLALAATGAALGQAKADAVADFYRGKQMQIVVRSSPGGSYDLYSRLVATAMMKYIPGNPTYITRYMTGAAGIQAVNFLENQAPKDGTVMTIVSNGLPADQALGLAEGMKADMGALNWIGNITSSNEVMVAWHTAPVKTFADAKKQQLIIGAAAASSVGTKFGAVANNILGSKFKIIYGYPGASDLNLAMERGETQGRSSGLWATVKATSPQWIKEKKLNVLVQIGLKRDPDLPDVPLLFELAENPEQRAVLEFITKGAIVGRPFAVGSGVPQERVEALRKAFDQAVVDPDFLAEAERMKAEISPVSGAELQQLIADVVSAPADIRAKAKKAMELKPSDAEETSKK
jgi:tripartite-type tricarboxylate transporter receptor subunit TctC